MRITLTFLNSHSCHKLNIAQLQTQNCAICNPLKSNTVMFNSLETVKKQGIRVPLKQIYKNVKKALGWSILGNLLHIKDNLLNYIHANLLDGGLNWHLNKSKKLDMGVESTTLAPLVTANISFWIGLDT